MRKRYMLLFEVKAMIPDQLFPIDKLKSMHLLLHPHNQIKQNPTTLSPDPLHSLHMKSKQIFPRAQNNQALSLRFLKLLKLWMSNHLLMILELDILSSSVLDLDLKRLYLSWFSKDLSCYDFFILDFESISLRLKR